jgi:cyclase
MTTIDRRSFLTTSAVAMAGVLGSRTLFAQAPATAGSFHEIRNGVGYFLGRGGTIGWAITPDAVVLVDSQFPNGAEACLDGLKTRTARRVDALINTHHHGDHAGGNAVFRPAVQTIVAHERAVALQRQVAAAANPPTPQAYADVTFNDTWRQTFGPLAVSAAYYGAAHTSGDIVVVFEQANVAHMGDLVCNLRHPNVDLPAGASVRSWVSVLERAVAALPSDTRYIVGHAGEGADLVVGRADVLRFRDYLSAALEYVQKARAAGRSKDELTRVEALPGFTDYQSSGQFTIGRVLGLVYDELGA